ncbi:MAG: hypothetical protein ABSC46_01235 [Candidatus Limnocylindrales bacterium]|jgi:hypothetical protein
MDVESLLRDALDVNRIPGEPGSGFDQRVMRSLRPRPRRRANAVQAFVGLAAVLALAAVLVPWYLGGNHDAAPGVAASPSISASAAASSSSPPTSSPSPSLAPTLRPTTHAKSWGLEFDYPAEWSLAAAPPIAAPSAMPSPLVDSMYARRVFGYVGTTTPATSCTDPVGLAGGGEKAGICTSIWSLGPGDVVVRFQKGDITGQNILQDLPGAGVTATVVGGVPAWFSRTSGTAIAELPMPDGIGGSIESAAGAETILVWELPGNETRETGMNTRDNFRIVAAVRGPSAGALEAEVRALVDSIKYDPPVVPLPADPAVRAALGQTVLASALGQLGPGLPKGSDCFPRDAGSKSAMLSVAPDGPRLTKPLPVVCSVAIEPNIMETWTITLTVTWEAAADRSAGRWVWAGWVNNKGQGGFGAYGKTLNDAFPYEVGSGKPG